MGDLRAMLSTDGDIKGSVSAGSMIINDYLIEMAEIPGGLRLTITRGSEVQSMDVIGGDVDEAYIAELVEDYLTKNPPEGGIPGEDGKSAYDIALENGFEGSEKDWLASLKGEPGPQGPQGEKGDIGPQGPQGIQGEKGEKGDKGDKGDDGTGVTILGSYASEEELRTAHPTGSEGDAYLINGDLYVWSATSSSWENVGNIKGPQGERGPRGEKGETGAAGADGISCTHSWNGTKLTVTSASGTSSADLKGDKGDTGAQGEQGIQGETGPAGANGSDGVSATHSWNGTILIITSASGTSSADLKGEKGDTGETGPQGEQGIQGEKGATGEAGYTPVRGTDYWTNADIAEIKAYVDDAILNGAW